MKKEDQLYIQHISDSIDLIKSYSKGIDKQTFLDTNLIQDGCIRQLEIIGEATKNLSTSLRNQYSDIPLKSMAGLRDILIHNYIGVDIMALWVIVKDNIPKLDSQINNILTDL